MRNVLAAAAVLLATAAPAGAVVVSSIESTSGADGQVFNAAPGVLQVDAVLPITSSVTFNLTGEPGDEGGISFDGVVTFITNFGQRELLLAYTPGSFTTLGNTGPASSVTSVAPGLAKISFNERAFDFADIGDVGFGGADFILSGLSVGQTASLTITSVPAPATLALFGLSAFGVAALRRR